MQGFAADLIGLAVLVMVAAFVKSVVSGNRDRSDRELYVRNLRKGADS